MLRPYHLYAPVVSTRHKDMCLNKTSNTSGSSILSLLGLNTITASPVLSAIISTIADGRLVLRLFQLATNVVAALHLNLTISVPTCCLPID
jgi:hypothetical protein